MPGIDAQTGATLDGFAHVEQSLEKLFTTSFGERSMREWVANPGTKLIGENITASVVLKWATIMWCLAELFEPRFQITQFVSGDVTRDGPLSLQAIGRYRPYAHLDWEQSAVFISIDGDQVTVNSAIG